MKLPEYFISCDWGTSNFRLRLVETSTLKVLAEYFGGQGIKPMSQQFLESGKANRLDFFSKYLLEQLGHLPLEYRQALVVISGMASSNLGMLDLPYADFPFEASGRDLNWKSVTLRAGQEVILVSGVKSARGMMRGEEVQAIGLEGQLAPHKKGILLLPGTHSKHLDYQDGAFTGLKNYMSGELFDLLAKHSILANSVQQANWTPACEQAFTDGVQVGFGQGLTASLFEVRAADILHAIDKGTNYYYLSGMIMGDELRNLAADSRMVFLAAANPLYGMYSLALESVLKPGRWLGFDEKILEHALLAGQLKILKQYVG